MALKSHLESDKEDEAEGIRTYGKRKKQHPQHAPMFAEMQQDEKKHHSKLSNALAGLKKVK
jgi:hypothetical protein